MLPTAATAAIPRPPRDGPFRLLPASSQPVVAGSWPSLASDVAMENYEPLPQSPRAPREPVCCSRDDRDGDVEGYVQLRNPHLAKLNSDHLYHLALSTSTHSLVDMFGDVKFVCMGGTPSRMEQFARLAKEELDLKLPTGTDLCDLSHYAGRYSMYKVGPLLSISHGMGAPSLSILLHEVFKLLHYARCRGVLVFRIGTSGGVGVPAGSVVVSTGAVNGLLREELNMHMLGKLVTRPAKLDTALAEEIAVEARRSLPGINVVMGKTMCADDFYEGQGRLDGAFCAYTDQEKLQFMKKLHSIGVVNIEMEATLFAAMCHHAGIKGAVVCVTLLDRLQGDQVTAPKSIMNEWQLRPQHVVLRFIQRRLAVATSSP
ncbi:hypothetical protein HPB49_021799 [Dermacentor silvarum]|uniref:Uncharacterized protein n=2 Tax=Dermacentor silvarum TaxID=543639 RepID=A0ACB8CT71_DERSI|nr:uridine phosphorylase 1 isoform X1 [Dermacentor silvarum]KAH7950278.1 hypothetical protein HPB49_021799 [Dermacentor silvarum]